MTKYGCLEFVGIGGQMGFTVTGSSPILISMVHILVRSELPDWNGRMAELKGDERQVYFDKLQKKDTEILLRVVQRLMESGWEPIKFHAASEGHEHIVLRKKID